MISEKLQIVILIAVLIYFVVIYHLLKKRSLSLKYTLLWIFSGLLLLIVAIFPQLLVWFTDAVGIQLPTNALFAIISFCGIMIAISLTAIVSKQREKIKRLAQAIALLEKRVEELEMEETCTEEVKGI